MAAPTQELPSWLSYIPTTITDGNGNVFTSSTLVYLPLTYYGPSIPLGPDWTYGGLTSPAPTTTSTDATAEPSTIITTTPTTSSAIPSTTSSTSVIPPSTSNSSSSPTSSLSSPSTFSASTSRGGPTSSATVAPIPSGGLERGQLVGIIVGSILAAIAIFLLVLICCLKRRRQRENRHSPSHSPEALDEWQIPHRSPNLRSGEADPFLDPTATGTASAAVAVAGPSRPRGGRRSSVPTTINDGSLSSGSNQSGYGTILEQPSLNLAPVSPPFEEEHNRPWQLRTLDEEESDDDHMYPEPGMVAAADLPPRLVGATQSEKSFHSRRTQRSSYPIDGDEPATLETARRIRVDGPRASPETRTLPLDEHDNDEPEPTRGMLGLTSLANLGRFSWFRNWDSLSRRHSAAADDLESGAALLGDAPPVTEMGERRRSRLGAGILGLTAEGSRPISDVSAKSATSGSGGTVYHDADSSLPSTPLLTPPPRALASTTEHNVRWARTESDYLTPVDQPPPTLALTPTSSHTAATGNQNVDILDLPAPKGISPFGSTASVHALPSPKAWNDTMGDTPSIGSFAANSEGTAGHGITIDVLEEDPPAATDTWRTMASVLGPPGARTTFGIPLVTQPADLTSEIGSLHSMRSHLSPRSTGSAPASREGSGSSGARSKSPSSLAHSGSVSLSSEERSPRSRVGGGPVSPALSAFGARGPGPVSPERAHLSDVDAVHGHGHPVDRRRALDDTRSQSPPLSPLLMSPWIGGLDADWQAT